MAQQDARVLIVAQADPLTDGGHAFLCGPITVVIRDGGLPEEQVQAVLGHIVAAVPRTRCLAPAEGVRQ